MKNKMIGAIVAGLGALSLVGVALANPNESATTRCLCDTVEQVASDESHEKGEKGPDSKVLSNEISLDAAIEVDEKADVEVAATAEAAKLGVEVDVAADAEITSPKHDHRDGGNSDDHVDGGDSKDNDRQDKHSKVRTIKRSVAGLVECTFEIAENKLRLIDVYAPGFDVDVDARSDSSIDLTLTKTLVRVDVTAFLDSEGDVTLSINE